MANPDVVAYNIAVFIASLFLLESGADRFLDHTAIVARRTRIPESAIGLLTAGGEWEELAVVIACILQKRASLAIGNIVGSAISNILGAFSLGLLFHDKATPIEYDRSCRIYSLVSLILTTFVVVAIHFYIRILWLICGSLLLAIFAFYVGSVAWAISQGQLTAPEDSDDGSSDDGSSGDESTREEQSNLNADASTPLLPSASPKLRHTLRYHVMYLVSGFLAICLAGYVLSHSATNIADEFGASDVLFGVVILAIATTLPEKFVAVMSGHRGQVGILVANTAGSNIFLLSLCLGITMLDAPGKLQRGNVNVFELVVLWVSTFAFTATVWFGGRLSRWIGILMLVCYIAFIVLEFAIVHRPAVRG